MSKDRIPWWNPRRWVSVADFHEKKVPGARIQVSEIISL